MANVNGLFTAQQVKVVSRAWFESSCGRQTSLTSYLLLSLQIAGYDVRKELPTAVPASLPVLVIHGDIDRSVYYTESKYILKGIKHAQLLTFKGIGHAWYDYYTTEYWAGLLNDFLDGEKVAALVDPTAKL